MRVGLHQSLFVLAPQSHGAAVQSLNNYALPFFEEHAVNVETVLSDNGREFCGREARHPYELFLQLEEIEQRTTQVGQPQSNGFIERFRRTLPDEHLRVKVRTTGTSGTRRRESYPSPWVRP